MAMFHNLGTDFNHLLYQSIVEGSVGIYMIMYDLRHQEALGGT